jgi:hypothetical protein
LQCHDHLHRRLDNNAVDILLGSGWPAYVLGSSKQMAWWGFSFEFNAVLVSSSAKRMQTVVNFPDGSALTRPVTANSKHPICQHKEGFSKSGEAVLLKPEDVHTKQP